jgi:hypothetical protein
MAPLREKWALARSGEEPTRIGRRTLQPTEKYESAGRLRANRTLVATATLALVVLAGVSGVVIHRVMTDQGEPVIRAHDGDVEVEPSVPAQNATAKTHGKIATLFIITSDPAVRLTIKQKGATVIDRTAKREIELQPGDYELELAEPSDNLRLSTNRLTLSRGPNFINVEPITREAPIH